MSINRDELLEMLTDEDIKEIISDLGGNYKTENDNEIIFSSICHHSDSYKLYYYKQSKIFHCFSNCGSLSLYDVILNALDLNNDSDGFYEAFKYVCNFKGISLYGKKRKGIAKREKEDTDLIFLNLHKKNKIKKEIKRLPSYSETVLKLFDNYYPRQWYEEGISEDVAEFFEIKMYMSSNKTIIPHRDYFGNLVGIRNRNFFEKYNDKGMKYMPLTIEKLTYKYPMNYNLYGIYQNKENIRKFKKAIIFESEKSVLKYGTYYGQDNNIALATCGMTLSLYQIFLLLSLGVNEIIIAFDKQYDLEKLDYFEQNESTLTSEQRIEYKKKKEEYNNYFKRIVKIYNTTEGYCNLSIISCWDDRIDYKDAPIDKGEDVYEELYQERYMVVDSQELKEMCI